MDFASFLDRLNDISSQEDLIGTGKDASSLKIEFEDAVIEAERLDQIAFLAAQEEGNKIEKFDFKTIKDEFFRIYKEYSEKRKKQLELKSALETENLRQKKALIDRLKEVIENEEKIGTAFNSYKEIHETWKKIGDIPRDKRDEIQKEYSRLLEMFFYTIKIYKELKEHDVKRNLQLKQDLIFKLKNLRNSQFSLRDLEATLRTLQDEWEEIGPVPNEEWEEVKKAYWDVVRSVYEKINSHYEEQRNVLAVNIEKKKALIVSLDKILELSKQNNSLKDWDVATKNVLEIQEDWKKIGFGTKKENEEVWKIFRSRCDEFFDTKKQFLSGIEEIHKSNADSKRKLIDEVDSFKTSTDWKQTTERIINVQKKWKSIGSSGPKWENKLWATFRAACDDFFTAKEKHFAQQDAALIYNLNAKKELLDALSSLVLSDNKVEAIQQLKDTSNRFAAIGHVPKNQADAIYKKFKSLMDEKYATIKLDENEKEKIQFQSKIDTLLSSPDPPRLLAREKSELRKQVEQLTKEIALLENNLGFFSKSKGAEQLRMDVEKKVKFAQDKITTLKKKISMLPNE
ncbi:MAG: DUF349 domain-containing protein [Bacteroidetes bacterium]|nr:DUF349 domain-containing protein [Bacteroidota bacterium]